MSLLLLTLFLLLLPFPALALRPFVLVISNDDLLPSSPLPSSSPSPSDFDDFPSSPPSLPPDPWLSSAEGGHSSNPNSSSPFSSALSDLMDAFSEGDPDRARVAVRRIEGMCERGEKEAQSAMGFLWGAGVLRRVDRARQFLYHGFAAEGEGEGEEGEGDLQSKMAMAYSYFRQEMHEKAVPLYATLAELAVSGSTISKEPPVVETVRLHSGTEENREALRKSRGEDDEDFQITEYQAVRGSAGAMYKMGVLYYYGLRGLRRDHGKARYWFLKSVEKGDTRALELLGEIYARGAGVERNYTRAFDWLSLAAQEGYYSAYNGLGYLYVKGYGVEQKNLTKAKEYFEIAAKHKEPGGHYNLGAMYLKGIGVERDISAACNYFMAAANAGQPKALFQLAKLFEKGIGLKKNLHMATLLYKTVAERGPWNSLARYALESYLKGDIGKALLLYSRMAELGYEVAQSNAAWILDRYGEQSMCMGESGGFCTDTERHTRAHSLWWQASEQGNEHAALLIGDAYYFGRGIERDFERAAEAYSHAQSQSNAQAMFNLGYMHEHGQGLPPDLHLAKRYYDQALQVDPAARLPVALALGSLWIRKNYGGRSWMVKLIDALPETYPKLQNWVEGVLLEEGNATILTLIACLATVLYLRERQRRQAVALAAQQQQPEEQQAGAVVQM